MTDQTFYRSVGGDLIAQGIGWLEPFDAEALAAVHQDEIAAAQVAGDAVALARARRLADQLVAAQESGQRWRRAGHGLDAPPPRHDRAG